MALFEGIELYELRRQAGRFGRAARGQPGQAGLSKDSLKRSGLASTLNQEPRLERSATGETHTLQQLATRIGGAGPDGVLPVEGYDVDQCAWSKLEDHGITGECVSTHERASQLGERPAKSPKGIVGLFE